MIPYMDMHCDTLSKAWMWRKNTILSVPGAKADLSRLKRGGCQAQFFAIYMQPISRKQRLGRRFPEDDAYIQSLVEIFQNTVKAAPNVLAQAVSLTELEENARCGRISGILTLEDGRAAAGRMEKLEEFYHMGIRLISLTWNHANCFGWPNSAQPERMSRGLTVFGKDAVVRMGELGMLMDVSHLSDGGFWDVARLCQTPFVASHSNCRALNPHPRSMTDKMIRALAERGGVMGVNFAPQFLTRDLKNRESRTEYLIAHLRHMVKVGGIGCAAIGTDFDGIHGKLEINGADRMPCLFQAMERAGFTTGEIEQIADGNVKRVLRDVMP